MTKRPASGPLQRHGAVLAVLLAYQFALNVQVFALNTLAMPAGERGTFASQVRLYFSYFFEPSELAIIVLELAICAGIYLLLDRLRHRSLVAKLLIGLVLTFAAATVMAAALRVYIDVSPMPLKQAVSVVIARNFLLSLTPLGLWVAVAIAFTHNRVVQERDRALAALRLAMRDAQLRALQYQLNPHFLFNSLNSLSAMVWDRDWKGAEAMVIAFSEFLREVLTGDPQPDVPLAREIELQSKYLAIEKIRFGERLEVACTVEPGLADQRVPNLILQPLVENAIRHAVARTSETVTVSIEARRDGDVLELAVEDSSAGSKAAARPGTGVGLSNVRERLAAQYGPSAELRAEHLPQGYRAVVRLPMVPA